MSNVFHTAGQKLRSNPAIVFIFLVFLIMLLVGLSTMAEDYMANLAGYDMLPTHHVISWVPYMVALLPQVGQIGFGYAFLHDTKQRWTLWLLLALHLVDLATDVVFKTPAWTPSMVLLTVVESEVIYTIGSHLMTVVSLGMLLELWPDTQKQLSRLFVSDGGGHNPSYTPPFSKGPGASAQSNLFANQPPGNNQAQHNSPNRPNHRN